METEKNILTRNGYEKLLKELDDLKNVRLEANKKKIKEAKEQGDLSENAEYDAAREEQREIYGRMHEIEEILKNVEVVDETDAGVVNIGTTVRLMDKDSKQEIEYSIVGTSEANIIKKKISNESPVGRALLGHKKGSTVKVEIAGGVKQYKILDIRISEKEG